MNQNSLDEAVCVTSDLWQIKDLLSTDELSYLTAEIISTDTWIAQELQTNMPRQTIPWIDDGIVDWLWCKLSELDFSRFNIKLRNISIWKDSYGYKISPHIDNSRVVAAMQIYLSENYNGLGTWFADDLEIPFVKNTGYLMHNRNFPVHFMKNSVPKDYFRLSFYARFDNL